MTSCYEKIAHYSYLTKEHRGKLFCTIMLFLFIPLLTSCVTAGLNLRAGIHSFQGQDYRSAFIHLKPEAERGQPDAQYAVGYMYYYGQGVVEDRRKAWYWINMAAAAGNPDAQEVVKILGHNE